MAEPREELERAMRALDDRVVAVSVSRVREATDGAPLPTPERATLIAAMSAAALAAAGVDTDRAPLPETKTLVDGAATEAAEAVFQRSPARIRVTGGEGQRDSSPGAHSGQVLGRGAAGVPVLDGIFDYVDGTTLAATGEPGALALGGLGIDLRPVPDLSAYLVLAPASLLGRIDIMSPPEKHAEAVLGQLARSLGKPVPELTVFTHSLSGKPLHQTLVELLRSRAGTVIVPPLVTIEPPYLVSLAGLAEPRIDTMIGSIGLSELAFAALLLDLVAPDHGFAFRAASIDGPRSRPTSVTLDPIFDFSPDEEREFARYGWHTDRQYTNTDVVRPGGGRAAVVFAVTDEPMLGLAGPDPRTRRRTQGLLFEPGGQVTRLEVFYG
ncbi:MULTISPECIES: fructose-bisphosphatase class II [Micromonospora]|uniref:Fructose-bisphosphatase class II n=1 Tax=Micromonospora chalcea TaxID=1874 RepID=A0ABX9Y6G9_MICCH|nr:MULTISPECIES: fructose-bisphosphatase class II [Micromonospora]NHO80545.1 fructose-bisphosphatase class II family protein [Micromonospora sp. CMU55-4]ODB81596.1 hypothetical protein A8711_14165 [Micromonospora sp. II]RQW94678.1 fructose-bisphosphatase class II [Micromonospora chalcea]RQX49504.1 fructose-bisphosphatase class II [Micromonospora chalcea]WBB83984.1 fructose-bisphosphatase class II [Micromonospora sp. WMMC264]